MTNAFVRDLSAHLDSRISLALDDFVDRCEVVDIDIDRAQTAAMTVLGVHLACITLSGGATEEQFLEMCRWHYRSLREQCGQKEVA